MLFRIFAILLILLPVVGEAKTDPSGFSRGFRSFQVEEYQNAVGELSKLRHDNFLLQDYTLYALGESLSELGRCAEAVPVLQKVVDQYPDSIWVKKAASALLHALICEGDKDKLTGIAEGDRMHGVSDTDQATFFLERAKLLITDGKMQEASRDLSRVIENYPGSQAVRESLALMKARGLVRGGDEWEKIAETLLKADNCRMAEQSLTEIDKLSALSYARKEALADCYFSKRNYAEAKEIYQKLCRGSDADAACLGRLSQAAARSDDVALAVHSNEQLIKLFPRAPQAKKALAKIAFLYEDSHQYAKALPVLKQLLQREKGQQQREKLLESLSWVDYRLGKFQEALQVLEQGEASSSDGFFPYWRGRILEKLGRKKPAQAVYDQLMEDHPGTYYAIRAAEHRAKGGMSATYARWWSPLGKPQWIKEVQDIPHKSDALKKAQLLMTLGFDDKAAAELRRFRAECRRCELYDATALPDFTKHGVYYRRSVGRQDAKFPLPWADVLLPAAEASHLDPYLAYAIMRQESRFNVRANSSAGAKGLMQLMPFTAKRIAEQADWSEFDPEQVFDPEVNIRLSLEYLKVLHGYFTDPLYSVASYNAGEEAVKRWAKTRGEMPIEEFIEEIPYAETRDYVKKVYANWQAYRFIYSGR